ncbi:MAG: oligosaccharide flippase family protein [Glaciecola sp.]
MSNIKNNIIKLMSGTAITQVMSVLALPILSRVYSPESFGVLGLFVAFATIMLVFTTMMLENGLLSVTSKKSSYEIIYLVTLSNLVFSLFSVVVYYFFIDEDSIKEAIMLVTMIAIYLIVTTFFTVLQIVQNKNSNYNVIVSARVSVTLTFLVTAYTLQISDFGLVYATVVANVVGLAMISRGLKFRMQLLSLQRIRKITKKYIFISFYLIPSALIQRLTGESLVLILNSRFSEKDIGYLSFYQKIISVPTRLIGNSVMEVIRSEIIRDKYNYKYVINIVSLTVFKLFLLGLAPAVILFMYGPSIFEFVFGSDWRIAGEIASLLSVQFLLAFCISPVTNIFYIYRKNSYDLYMQLYVLAITAFAYFYTNGDSLLEFLKVYTVLFCTKYIIELSICAKIIYEQRELNDSNN